MVFDRFVQAGRVIQITCGPLKGKVAVIVDIVDHNRALVDGPSTDVPRQVLSFKHMKLTKFLIHKFPRGARSKTVKKYFEKEQILQKWEQSGAAKKVSRTALRASLTDFDRYKVSALRRRRAYLIKTTA